MKIDKTEAEVLIELIKSLNNGNVGYTDDRVTLAKRQLKELKKTITFKKGD